MFVPKGERGEVIWEYAWEAEALLRKREKVSGAHVSQFETLAFSVAATVAALRIPFRWESLGQSIR